MGQKGIWVLGMHRTGTSAVTRLLVELGAHVPGKAMAANASNPEGYWEPEAVVRIHDRFLDRIDSGWRSVAPLPRSVFHGDAADDARRELADLVDAEPELWQGPWVVKDPRLCRLTPLWQELTHADRLGAPRVLHVLRSPLASAASLAARDDMGLEECLLLWARHYLEAEAASREHERAWLSFEPLQQEISSTAVDALGTVLGRSIDRVEVEAARSKVLKRKLVHHRFDVETTRRALAPFPIPATVFDGCTALEQGREEEGRALLDRAAGALALAFERWQAIGDDPDLKLFLASMPAPRDMQRLRRRIDEVCRDLDVNWRENEALRQELDEAAAGLDKVTKENRDLKDELAEVGAGLDKVTAENAALKKELDAADVARRRSEALLAARQDELDQARAHGEQVTAQLLEARQERDDGLAAANGELQRILGSRSYRVFDPVRRLYGLLRRS